uniref:Uncharacterized protein n=1 Tax=Anopheles merus TaxID=30066 RepID=A0A182URN4_ANOME
MTARNNNTIRDVISHCLYACHVIFFSLLFAVLQKIDRSRVRVFWGKYSRCRSNPPKKSTAGFSNGCFSAANYHFLCHLWRGWHCPADCCSEGPEPWLAVLLHGPDEPADWTEAAPEHNSHYGT